MREGGVRRCKGYLEECNRAGHIAVLLFITATVEYADSVTIVTLVAATISCPNAKSMHPELSPT